MEYEFPNDTRLDAAYWATSCVNNSLTPAIYDPLGERTFWWFGEGDWVPVRGVPRVGPCTRWICAPRPGAVPQRPPAVLAAVVSRDGKSAFGYGWADPTQAYRIMNNFCFTCFHIDPVVTVPAGQSRLVRSRIYMIQGGLEELKSRFVNELDMAR